MHLLKYTYLEIIWKTVQFTIEQFTTKDINLKELVSLVDQISTRRIWNLSTGHNFKIKNSTYKIK